MGGACVMAAEDLDWLEVPDGESVPTRNLTKHDLSRATGYNLKTIDRLVREGLPARPGASKREGLRFSTLATTIEWIAEHRAQERAGPEDQSTAGARRRLALARARAAELANAEREEELIPIELLTRWIEAAYSDTRERLLGLSGEVPNLSEEQRHAMDRAINGALEEISSEAWARASRVRSLEKGIEAEAAAEEELDFG